MFNNLIGLQYKWGSHPLHNSGFTDCFALSMEIRRRLGLHDFYADYQWVYENYEEGQVSARQILQWVWKHTERTDKARAGAIFKVFGLGYSRIALATVIDDENALLISSSRGVVAVPFAKVAKRKFYWAD